jgi:anti-sigma factor RsiW
MNCPDEMKMEMLLNGAIPADEAECMERHVRECPKCGAVYRELKSLDKLIESAAPALPDAEYMKSLSEQLGKSAAAHREKAGSAAFLSSRIFWGIVQAAAMIIIAVSIWALAAPSRSPAIKIEKQETEGIKTITFVTVAREDKPRNALFGPGSDLMTRL